MQYKKQFTTCIMYMVLEVKGQLKFPLPSFLLIAGVQAVWFDLQWQVSQVIWSFFDHTFGWNVDKEELTLGQDSQGYRLLKWGMTRGKLRQLGVGTCTSIQLWEWIARLPCHIILIFFAYYSIPLCSPVMPIILLKLTSNYAKNVFSTQTKYLVFYACTCYERREAYA